MRAHHCCPDIMSGTDPTLRFAAETSSLLREREKLHLLWTTAMTNKTWPDPSISKPCSSQRTIYTHTITQKKETVMNLMQRRYLLVVPRHLNIQQSKDANKSDQI